MPYGKRIRKVYQEYIINRQEEGRFLILVFFTVTFIASRLIVYGIEHNILNFPPFGFVYIHSTHIHHLVFGIFLLLIAGLIRIPSYGNSYIGISSILYGIGSALTLDEFAIWLRLDADAYFGPAGRISVDIVIIFFLILLTSLWHFAFYRRLFRITRRFLEGKEEDDE